MRTRIIIQYLLGIFCFFAACHVGKQAQESMLPEFDKEGHRGCRGLMPENTIPAMIHALELGVTTLEMDATITKDNQVILSHEPFFNHEITTKPDGTYIAEKEERSYNIHAMTYEEVQRYDVGMKPHPRFPGQQKMPVVKPLLSQVIDTAERWIAEHDRRTVFYNIETKTQPLTDGIYHPGPEAFVDLLMKVINDKGIGERVIIQSFDFRTLQYLHQKYPAIKTAMLIEDFDKRGLENQLHALGFDPTIYSPAWELVTPELLTACHAKNIKVIPWTVNTKEEIGRLKDMGVDGIITDDPRLFN